MKTTESEEPDRVKQTDSETSSSSAESGVLASFPTAVVEGARPSISELYRGSKLWLLTLACLVLAVGLVWWSLPQRGINIQIQFPDGHGLEAEDSVRFRGIDVGEVSRVSLNPELGGVNVIVRLKPSAARLARKGTRFWIVRPQLSISGISGLETAVGHKYIGLIPGDAEGTPQYQFTGLSGAPPDALSADGIELIFRGEKRHSVSIGSPVTYRGVEVGRILAVGLSSDARYVDVRARIFQQFRNLITTETVFWASSGVNVDFSFGGGLKLDTESLETIARGGVSMLTIKNGGQSVQSGHVFELFGKPEEGWYESARNVRAAGVEPRGALPLIIRWKKDGILGGDKEQTVCGIPVVDRTGETYLIVPGRIYESPRKMKEGTLSIGPAGFPEQAVPLVPDGELAQRALVKLNVAKDYCKTWLSYERDFRSPESPEDCLAVRASMPGSATSAYVHYAIDEEDIDEEWKVPRFDGDSNIWDGAPVLSNVDGKVIGVLSIARDGLAEILRIENSLSQE